MAVQMVSEQQKYLSGIFRNIGIACSAPLCSILFQWFVSKQGAYFGHIVFAVLIFLVGILFLYVGYEQLKEKNK